VAEPWTADYRALSTRQKEVMKSLAAVGVFGDYRDTPNNMKKGRRWVPIPKD
jgi:hypothetical protein